MRALSTLFIVILAMTTACNTEQKDGKGTELVNAFYEQALTVNEEATPKEVLNEILADGYVSEGSEESKTKDQLVGQLEFFWELIPNLKWEIQEVIQDKNRFIVRSMASGNSKGDFMGQSTDGSKPFKIMTIDIHTVENGKIKQTYHVEDWATAMKQLAGENQSKETMNVAMEFMGAMGKGDMDKLASLMHDDMVWHNEGDSNMPWIGPWEGKKVILEKFMPVFGENFKTIKWEPNDALSNGDTAAFFGRMIGLLTKSNVKTKEFTYALRVKVKDGKIILWNWFEDSYQVSKAYHGK